MPFSHILGQETAIATLRQALLSNKVHHAYRFEGPEGVGKEMAAFALAQALVCAGGDPLGCGQCDACRRAITLADDRPRVPLHPDIRLIERGLYPPDIIGQRNEEAKDISVNQIRSIVLANAQFPPHEGRARVFILRRAEEMSVGAANAILKILEEPRAGTHFILLTSRPDYLLTTIRSRTLPLRFGPLPDELLRTILTRNNVPEDRWSLALELASGSASAVLALTDAEESASRDAFVNAALQAALAPHLGPGVALAETKDRDKETLRQNLRALAAVIAQKARKEALSGGPSAQIGAAHYGIVQEAMTQLDRNASQMLVVTRMIAEMQRRTS